MSACAIGERRDAAANRLVDVDRLLAEPDLTGRHPGNVEQIVDEPAEDVGLALDHRQSFCELLALGVVAGKLRREDDRAQRIAQLVTEHR